MSRRGIRRLCWFFVWLVWGGVFVVLALNPGVLDVSWLLSLALATWLLSVWNAARHSADGVFSPPVAYLVLLGLFHFGLLATVSLGLEPPTSRRWLTSQYLPTAVALCGAALSFFTSGATLATVVRPRRATTGSPSAASASEDFGDRRLYVAGLALGLLGLCLLVAGAGRLGFFSVSYSEAWLLIQTRDPRMFGVGMSLALMGMVVSAVAADKRRIRYVALLFAGAFAPLVVYGFRGHFAVYFTALLLIWHRKDPPAAVRVAVVFAVVALVFAPAIVLTRSGRAGSISQAIQAVRLHSLFTEMGNSMQVLVETVGATQQGDVAYWQGRSYALALRTVVPNVFGAWHPAASRSEEAPAAWVANRILPWVFSRGGGAGFSGVAEPYLNFGIPGVVLFFALLGYALMQLQHLPRRDVHLTAVAMCAVAALLWTTRNDFTNLVRPVVWGACFVYLIKMLPRRN